MEDLHANLTCGTVTTLSDNNYELLKCRPLKDNSELSVAEKERNVITDS